jgi:hypothetical protein
MRNGTVAGSLSVKGSSAFESKASFNSGISVSVDETPVLSITDAGTTKIIGDLLLTNGGGIKLDDNYVISVKNNKVVSFSAANRTLNLGDNDTVQINLQADMYDDDGEYKLVSKFGDGYFPNSFKAGHYLSVSLIETYKNTSDSNGVAVDAGIIIGRYLRFGSDSGPGLHTVDSLLTFEAPYKYNAVVNNASTWVTKTLSTSVGYEESESLYASLVGNPASLNFKTDADFYVFDKPVEGKISIGIAKSKTKLTDNQLFFDDAIYWQGITDGVKFYGNGYFVDDIGSVSFSSGFAGSGWKILTNKLTGNVSATFDELTVRKKMRVYELEVQKQTSTNGSLWVSDACSGDTAEEIA